MARKKRKKSNKTTQSYIRHSVVEDLSILSQATDKPANRRNKVKVEINGETINMSSLRLLTFKDKGVDCVSCSTKGKFLALERNYSESVYHINLYGIDSEGKEVLMTKDHILPKSKGGADKIENMQTMCIICNGEKGNTI